MLPCGIRVLREGLPIKNGKNNIFIGKKMVQKKYTPEEALQRVKLMMKYDSSITLTENKSKLGLLSEQSSFSQVSAVAKKIHRIMSGDVETSDLNNLLDLLSSEVFGKKMEDGTCMMSKVVQYYGKSGSFGGAGGGLLGTGDLLKDIEKSTEFGEAEFEDVKQELISKIKKEMTSCGGGKKKTDDGDRVVTPRVSKYKACSGTYKEGCEASAIGKVQGCLNDDKTLNLNPKLVPDGKFGPRTKEALAKKGFTSFTDSDVEKICKGAESKPEISSELDQINVADL